MALMALVGDAYRGLSLQADEGRHRDVGVRRMLRSEAPEQYFDFSEILG
jgi:hypothetical protein